MNTKKVLTVLIATAIVIASVFTAVCISGCGGGKDESKSSTADEASAKETIPDEATYNIPLGFVDLRYPAKWEKAVTVDGVEDHKASDSFTLAFAKDKTKLFDLYFNGEEGDLLGTLITDDGNTKLTVKMYDIKEKDAELSAMQEAVNVILTNLNKDHEFVYDVVAGDDNAETFKIETGRATLYYPQKWEKKVKATVDGDTVHFVQGDTKLFDICFGSDKGALLGTYDGASVTVVEYKTKTDEQALMIEDINVILEHLREDPKFSE